MNPIILVFSEGYYINSLLVSQVRGLRTNITYEFRELKNDAVSDSTSLAVTDPEPTVTVVTVQPTLQTCPRKLCVIFIFHGWNSQKQLYGPVEKRSRRRKPI